MLSFFFLQDQKQPLASRKEKLANMVFQAQLGTLWDKSTRIAKLAVAFLQSLVQTQPMLKKLHYLLNAT